MSYENEGMETKKQKDITWKHNLKTDNPVSSKAQSFTITMRSLRELAEKEAQLVQYSIRGMKNNLVDPNFILELTKSIHASGEKSISDYILRNKEILLNEHSSGVRRQVIQDMRKQIVDMNEKALKDAEKLEGDVENFMELIQSNEKLASVSFERVCEVAKENEEKAELVKRTKEELFLLKTEVEKSEKVLIEYLMCTAFLELLASAKETVSKHKFVFPKGFLQCFSETGGNFDHPDEQKLCPHQDVLEKLLESGEEIDSAEVPFESPDQVLKILESLKDRNLALIHNSRLSKGTTKDEMSSINEVKLHMYEELKELDDQITKVENNIIVAEENHENLKNLMLELTNEDLDKEETTRRKKQMDKIVEIYKLCTGSDAKTVDLTLMRATIDSYLESLMHNMSKYPRKTIKRIMKRLEAEKKLSERKASEALRAQRLNERMKTAAASNVSQKKSRKILK